MAPGFLEETAVKSTRRCKPEDVCDGSGTHPDGEFIYFAFMLH